jgi:hypothetical protein
VVDGGALDAERRQRVLGVLTHRGGNRGLVRLRVGRRRRRDRVEVPDLDQAAIVPGDDDGRRHARVHTRARGRQVGFGLQRRVAHGNQDVAAHDADVIGGALRLDLGDAHAGAGIRVLLAPARIQGDGFDAEPGAGTVTAPAREIGVQAEVATSAIVAPAAMPRRWDMSTVLLFHCQPRRP